ncbi:MAG TPA: glycosyltransferase [Vicinamibacterales bacterium]
MKKRSIALHDQATELQYPDALESDIRLLFGVEVDRPPTSSGCVISIRDAAPGRYSLESSSAPPHHNLSKAQLFDALLERAVASLIEELDSAVALHSAAIGWHGKSILFPGPTGAGKSSLAAWFSAEGFDFLSDELVLLLEDAATTVSFPRPLIARAEAKELATLLERCRGQIVRSAANVVLCQDEAARRENHRRPPALIVFPRFARGEDVKIASVRPAIACLKLMECNLNARNLNDHGLGLLSDFCRRTPAVSLTYGSYDQLAGVADVLVKFVAATDAEPAGLQKFLAATAPSRTGISSRRFAPPAPSAASVVAPLRTPADGAAKRLSIGMATYDDYDGVYFTVQAIRMYHPEILDDTEFLVIDNNPLGACAKGLKDLENWVPNYRYIPQGEISGTAVRDWVFQEARGEFVLCADCHILIQPGSLRRLLDYFEANPNTNDLLQGPLIYDDLKSYSTHFKPGWSSGMYGAWASDPAGADPDNPPFEIPMQGLGLFACRREAWPGFNPAFRGFGGEEGYIHEKFRQRGGKALCLPFLRWMHRFNRPAGAPYANRWEDRVRNYLIGFQELGWDTDPVFEHFREFLGEDVWSAVLERLGSDWDLGGAAGNGRRDTLERTA